MCSDLQFQLTNVTSSYEKFKVHNDLDRLFAKGIDVPTCKRVLEACQELEKRTNWASIDKEVVNQLVPKECQKHLQAIVNDGERLVIKKLETTENVRDAPLPVHMFGD